MTALELISLINQILFVGLFLAAAATAVVSVPALALDLTPEQRQSVAKNVDRTAARRQIDRREQRALGVIGINPEEVGALIQALQVFDLN